MPKVSIEQVKAARALLKWSQNNLAQQSGLSLATIKRLEAASGSLGGRKETTAAIISCLEQAGISFSNKEGLGVRLAKK